MTALDDGRPARGAGAPFAAAPSPVAARLAGLRRAAHRKVLKLGDRLFARRARMADTFVSLGDNCEFGLVQQRIRGRALGLFNNGRSTLDGLIAALDTRFTAVIPEHIGIGYSKGAYDLHLGTCPVSYHTNVDSGSMAVPALLRQERRRLQFLVRKLVEDLDEADKIFVYKTNDTAERWQIDRLVAKLRQYGPNTLLWVTLRERGCPIGAVEELGEGLLRGHIDRFAPYLDAHAISWKSWQLVCTNAYRMWQSRHRQPRPS